MDEQVVERAAPGVEDPCVAGGDCAGHQGGAEDEPDGHEGRDEAAEEGEWGEDANDDLVDHADLMDELFEVERRIMEKNVEAFVASPTEVAWLDICWATGANMGPGMFERWVLPEIQLTAEMVRKVPHKFIGLYTLGRIRELLPMMVEARPHFIETFEPNEGDISLREAKRLYGDRICIMGNFDCVVLAYGTEQQAREEARRCLREAMQGGGYIMVTGDEVPADAKWENLRAMVEVCEQEGRYE